ncbi:MAG: hypothetical protein ACUZ8H_16280 [Candidatus Anammoxibacter sp.]
MQNDGGLVFDAENHRYFYNGKQVPGITTVMSDAGLTDYKYCTERGLVTGDFTHQIIEYYNNGELDKNSIDVELQGYFESFLQLEHYGIVKELMLIEKPVYHYLYGYATKSDACSESIVFNWKCGSFRKSDFIQMAAEIEIHKAQGFGIKEGLVVCLDKDGGLPKVHTLSTFKYRKHLNVYLSALTIYKWKGENK